MPTNLQPLIDAYKDAKEKVDEAKTNLTNCENQILETLGDELKKGTNNFGELKIVCANSEKWDQLELAAARNEWPSTVPFPFESEYCPDNKAIAYLRDNQPEVFVLLQGALSVTGKKPAFSISKKKGE